MLIKIIIQRIILKENYFLILKFKRFLLKISIPSTIIIRVKILMAKFQTQMLLEINRQINLKYLL